MAEGRERPKLVQVHPRLPAELVERIDEFAERRNISRLAAINVLLAKALGLNGEPEAAPKD